MILEVFNDVLSLSSPPPGTWSRSRLLVLLKKGDPTIRGNYRPICILPLMYKLFSRMLCERLSVFIMPLQAVDQAAYRKGYSTDDHSFVITQLIEKSNEYNFPLWMVLIDYTKAFDSVEHSKLWEVLRDQNVPDGYIRVLQNLYFQQTAYVKTDVCSEPFFINRGVRQGDPLSSLLFIAVMEHIFTRLKATWRKSNRRRTRSEIGIRLSADGETLTNLRFADDCVLIAQSKADAMKMLQLFIATSAEYGLSVHPGKTKFLTWDSASGGCTSVVISGQRFEVVSEHTPEKYLGRKLQFYNCHQTEFKHRVAAGWARFRTSKQELTGKDYNIGCRLRLFQAAITTTVLYGACTWALTKKMSDELDITRRKMLRYVLRIFRKKDESWVDYLHRAARGIERCDKAHGLQSWTDTYRMRKWRFAGQLARHHDSRWSSLVCIWAPSTYRRHVGRPTTRWEDDIVRYAGGGWASLAQDEDAWTPH